MKVLTINGSPTVDKGITARILGLFLNGMRDAGAKVELIYLAKKNIAPCRGCLDICLFKTPGICYQKDDMVQLLHKQRNADMVVYATPVYLDGMTGTMKNFVDRSLPLLQGFLELRDGHLRHPTHNGKHRRMVVVSTCGLAEMDNFDPLIAHFQAIAKNMDMEYLGALVRPSGVILDLASPEKLESICNAIKAAGREIVAYGKLSPATFKAASEEIMPPEEFMNIANAGVQAMIDQTEELKRHAKQS
jgi:multimeric flavodoxin WrbA